MFQKLSVKIVLSFVITSLLTFGMMAWVLRVQLSGNFDEYLQEVQKKRLSDAAQVWEQFYEQAGSWEAIRDQEALQNQVWRNIALSYRPAIERGMNEHQPRHMTERGRGRRGRFEGKRHMMGSPGRSPLMLLDLEGNQVSGVWIPENRRMKIALNVKGEKVGYLVKGRPPRFSQPVEVRFLSKQRKWLLITAIGATLFAALVSGVFTHYFLSPVSKITKGTKEIINRKFDTQIEVKTNDELGQLSQHFNRMANALGNFEIQRTQWLTDIAHELRTPLSILQGEVEAILDGVRPRDDEQLGKIHQEILYLEKFVEELRLLSLANADELTFQWAELDLVEILISVQQEFENEAVQKNLEIQLPELKEKVFIQGDEDKLRQVFGNIFQNTIRYASPGNLKIVSEIKEQEVQISFLDSGPGVPHEDVHKLFDRLFRVDRSRSRAKGGTGLGLSITKAIVEKHHGRISAFNREKEGLGITMSFPLSKNHQGEST